MTKTAQTLTAGDVIALDGVPCLVLNVCTTWKHGATDPQTRVSFRPATHPDGAAVRWMAPEHPVTMAQEIQRTAAQLRAMVGDCVASRTGAHRVAAGQTHCSRCGAN